MKPEARCSLRNSQRAWVSVSESEYMQPCGGITPSGVTILRLYGWWGAREPALALLKTSAKSLYTLGIGSLSVPLDVDHAKTSGAEMSRQ